MAESSTKKLKINRIITLGLILCVLNGCGYSGGMTAEESKRESVKTFEKQKKALVYFQNEGLQYAEQIISTAQKSYANGDMSYWSYISFLNQAIDIKKQNAEAINTFNQSAIQLQFPSFNIIK